MKECVIELGSSGNVDILRFEGSLDAYSYPRLDAMLSQLRDNKRVRIVLDCRALEYVSSASLGAVIGFARYARDSGGDVKLAHLRPRIRNIVELLGFNKILEICPTTDDAVKQFNA